MIRGESVYNRAMPLGDATTTPLPPLFSVTVAVTLAIVLGASIVMYRMLVVRWTVNHRRAEIRRWADANDAKLLSGERARLIPPLDAIRSPEPVAVLLLEGAKMSAVEMRTAVERRTDTSQYTRWHAVIRSTSASWPPTGLRPRANPSSLLDLFPLSSFPSLLPPERFVVFGTESQAARRLAGSKLAALMPADIGLLLHGPHVVLDFSSRPLDSIELTRLSVIIDQVVANLPVF